jgi:hypothetical protein
MGACEWAIKKIADLRAMAEAPGIFTATTRALTSMTSCA